MRNYYFLIVFFLLLSSCDPDEDNQGHQNIDGFDRSEMLINWADNIIIPAYDEFNNTLNELNTAINSFISNPSISTLDFASDAWLNSYKYWQHVEMFDIGLAEVINYKGKMNIYPTDS